MIVSATVKEIGEVQASFPDARIRPITGIDKYRIRGISSEELQNFRKQGNITIDLPSHAAGPSLPGKLASSSENYVFESGDVIFATTDPPLVAIARDAIAKAKIKQENDMKTKPDKTQEPQSIEKTAQDPDFLTLFNKGMKALYSDVTNKLSEISAKATDKMNEVTQKADKTTAAMALVLEETKTCASKELSELGATIDAEFVKFVSRVENAVTEIQRIEKTLNKEISELKDSRNASIERFKAIEDKLDQAGSALIGSNDAECSEDTTTK